MKMSRAHGAGRRAPQCSGPYFGTNQHVDRFFKIGRELVRDLLQMEGQEKEELLERYIQEWIASPNSQPSSADQTAGRRLQES